MFATKEMVCSLCDSVIFVEQQPIHYDCMSRRENVLMDMIFTLHSELDSMKNSFKSMESIFSNIAEVLNMNLTDCEGDSEPKNSSISPRNLRPSTLEKTKSIQNSRKKGNKITKANLPSLPGSCTSPARVSPLVIPNGSSVAQNIRVTRSNNKTSTVNVTLQSRTSATPRKSDNITEVLEIAQPEETTIVAVDPDRNVSDIPIVTRKESIHEDNAIVGIHLSVAEPTKTVFVTGFGLDTTADILKAYIAEHFDLSNVAAFHVHQLKVDSTRGYTSFKLFAGRNVELFKALIDPRFWPEGIISHEHFRRNPRHSSNNR